MKEHFVITGGSGFIGCRLGKVLAEDHKVLSIDRINPEITEGNINYLNLDIQEKLPELNEYKKATVIHTAALMNAHDIDDYWRVNVIGTKNVLDWSIKHNSKHFIFISSGSVYGYVKNIFMKESDPFNPIGAYGHTKWLGENISQMYSQLNNLPVTILRLYFPYGPGQETGIFKLILNSIKTGNPLTIKKNGGPKFRPIHIDDLISAIIKVIDNDDGFRIFNLCGDESISFLRLVRLIENEYQCKAKLTYTDEEESDLLADNEKIKRELRWNPEKRLAEEIKSIL